MSVAILSDRHFQVIGEYAAEWLGANAGTIADTLKRENYKSYNYRYDEKHRCNKVKFLPGNSNSGQFNHADIKQLCDCVTYQYEGPDYDKTVAHSIATMIGNVAKNLAKKDNQVADQYLWFI